MVHRPHIDGDHGSDQVNFPHSLEKYGGGTGQGGGTLSGAPLCLWWCTLPLLLLALALAPLGHI